MHATRASSPMAEPVVQDEDAVELDALERLVRRADGFALAFARVNSLPRRRELAADLRRRLDGAVRVVEVDVPPETTDLQAVLARIYEKAEGDDKLALFVYGIERVLSSVRERTGFLPVLNYKRENLQRSVPAPVVLWVPEFALRHIARGAPDTWAWRSGVFEFATPPEETDRTWQELRESGVVDEYARMRPAERHARIETLEALYHDYAEGHDVGEPELAVVQADLAGRLALLYEDTADLNAALKWSQRSLEERERTLGPDHLDTLSSVSSLGAVLHAWGDLDGAEQLFRRALAGYERTLGPDHLVTLRMANNLGAVLWARDDLDEVEQLFQRALKRQRWAFSLDHPDKLALIHNLGSLLHKRGDLNGAERLYRRALEGHEQMLGPDRPSELSLMTNLGSLLQERGDLDGAEEMLQQALGRAERALGPDHLDTLRAANHLGNVLWARGDLDGTEQLFRRVLGGSEFLLGPDHPDTRLCRERLNALLAQRHPAPE